MREIYCEIKFREIFSVNKLPHVIPSSAANFYTRKKDGGTTWQLAHSKFHA